MRFFDRYTCLLIGSVSVAFTDVVCFENVLTLFNFTVG